MEEIRTIAHELNQNSIINGEFCHRCDKYSCNYRFYNGFVLCEYCSNLCPKCINSCSYEFFEGDEDHKECCKEFKNT
jgi:hypothetical protein